MVGTPILHKTGPNDFSELVHVTQACSWPCNASFHRTPSLLSFPCLYRRLFCRRSHTAHSPHNRAKLNTIFARTLEALPEDTRILSQSASKSNFSDSNMAPKCRREDWKRLCRYFEKGLAAKLDSTRCADCMYSIALCSMTSMLICFNQTIYCLLIQPNPDSALNATAGHLLQDNYDSFARQARLMTSIHASIPSDARDAVLLAKRRGEIAGTAVGEDTEQRPMTKGKPASPSTRHPMRKLPECVTHEQSAPSTLHQALEDERPASEDEDDTSASKENDPLLSRAPVPVPVPSSRRPSMAKRPLSDLHIVKPEHDTIDATCSSPLEQSAVNNAIPSTSIATSYSSRKGLQLAEKSQSLNKTGHNNDNNGMCSDDFDGRATKRICSDFGKEDTLETRGARKLIETVLPTIGAASKVGGPSSRKASESSSSGISSVKGKARVGLRRLWMFLRPGPFVVCTFCYAEKA